MNVAGGDEGVNARAAGVRQRLGGAFHIERAAARQGRHLRPGKLAADGLHRFEIAFRGDGEAGFQDVHAEFHQFAGHAQLFRDGHAAARRLLAVAQRGVEDVYAVAHRITVGHYGGSLVGFGKFIIFVGRY